MATDRNLFVDDNDWLPCYTFAGLILALLDYCAGVIEESEGSGKSFMLDCYIERVSELRCALAAL